MCEESKHLHMHAEVNSFQIPARGCVPPTQTHFQIWLKCSCTRDTVSFITMSKTDKYQATHVSNTHSPFPDCYTQQPGK